MEWTPGGSSELCETFLSLLYPAPSTSNSFVSLTNRLNSLKKLILLEGVPTSREEAALIRPLVWKLLLHLHLDNSKSSTSLMDAAKYHDLTARQPSIMWSKIKNDSFRTLASDAHFLEKVREEDVVRCLEAFVWRQLDAANEISISKPKSNLSLTISPSAPYVQGMNVLAAPFLYVCSSQLEAFACFTSLIEQQAPMYVRPTLDGVHMGLKLVDRCLSHLDPPLHQHLLSHSLTAELYAFPSLLTFSASTPPLDEVLQLWDFLLAYGVGLNVLCIVAQLWIMRDDLLASASPMKILRTFPPLKARDIVPLAVQSVADLPAELFDLVARHPWDSTVVL